MRKKDLKGEVNLLTYPKHAKWLREQRKGIMPYHGVYCFCGKQGSGKTLSAIRLINNIFADFPDTLLISNVDINFDILNIPKENFKKFTRYYQLFENYDKPTIFFIDEAHILFNSLNSRNTDVNLFQVISQNRKRKRIFVLTSQVFNRLELVMREQINTIIPCITYANFLTHCLVYSDFDKQKDEIEGKKEFGAWFTHNRHLHYQMYDTTQVIDYSKDSDFWNTKEQDRKESVNIERIF